MKMLTKILVCSVLAAVAAWNVAAQVQDEIVDQFNDPDQGVLWSRWWGGAPQTYEFDATVDADGNANSGSLKATVEFDLAAYGGDNQFAVRRDWPEGGTIDGTKYTNFVFDLKWDASSPKNSAGNFGYLEYGFRNSDWSQTWLGGRSIPADQAGQWIHVAAAIDPATTKLDTIAGVVLKLWSGNAGGLTGTAVFWVDNVKLLANTNVEVPPPTMAITKAVTGLNLAASASGQQYQRQSVHTLATDADGYANFYSWVANPTPVTYSLTIKTFPDAAHSGFQAHIFLVPENALVYGANDAGVDWNAGNVVFVQIANNADGTASGRFMYKTNQPGGNSMLWNADPANGPVGTLATISDASALGTWSVTLKSGETDTEGTLTSPGGASTSFTMPGEAANLFADPIYAYFGIQPNTAGNIGQAAVFGRIQIAGATPPLDDDFSGETLDLAKWNLAAADAPGVVVVPPTAAYWVKWTAPALGFELQASPDLSPGSWGDPGVTTIFQIGKEKVTFVPASILPGAKNAFFRMMKP